VPPPLEFGPPELRLDAFMARANAAYYANHDPFQDFTTSPEIAQVFGELLGLWAAVTWRQIGAPAQVKLVEAGPGRGTLMRDALRAASRVAPDFHAACDVHFIETSPRLRESQAALVPGAHWHDALDNVPDGPALVLANEFLDALPIRQFERSGGVWSERFVAHGRWVLRPAVIAGTPEDGTVTERCEAACAWTAAPTATRCRPCALASPPIRCKRRGRRTSRPMSISRPSPKPPALPARHPGGPLRKATS